MIHNAASIVYSDAEGLKKEAKELDRLNQHLAERLAARTGKTVKEILKMMDEETYLYGQEIVDNGFADELIEVGAVAIDRTAARRLVADATAQHKRRTATDKRQRINVDKSQCQTAYELAEAFKEEERLNNPPELMFFDEETAQLVNHAELARRTAARKNAESTELTTGRETIKIVTY